MAAGSSSSSSATPKAAQPTRTFFDSWNSSSTGHQRAENRLSGSTSWRESRTQKLASQLSDQTRGGGQRVADTVGAGSPDFGTDGRTNNGGWERGAPGLRRDGQLSLFECQTRQTKRAAESPPTDDKIIPNATTGGTASQAKAVPSTDDRPPQIFRSLVVYVNGSTAPLISDHALKRLLVEHGAAVNLVLGHRTVTHVILGRTAANGGAGGGLAAGKAAREVSRLRARGVRFVSAEWVLESVKAGRRLGEGSYGVVHLAGARQSSLKSAFTAAARKS